MSIGFLKTRSLLPLVMILLVLQPVWLNAQEDGGGFVDYVRQAFNIVREHLEGEHGGSLDYVRSWQWEETSWQYGIDDCVSAVINDDPGSARPIFIGWEFNITSLTNVRMRARISYSMEEVAICDEAPVILDSEAAVAAPVVTAAGGFELGGHIAEFSDRAIGAARNAGMTWLKKQYRYQVGEGTGNALGLIQAAKANGFKIKLSVIGNKNELSSSFDSYIQSYANFVGELAAGGADAIEVWNEPNLDREWPGHLLNGANYTRLLQASYQTIKNRNGATLVVSGAPSPVGHTEPGRYIDDSEFFRQMATAGANQYMDCVGSHYNEGIISPNQQSGDPRGGHPTRYFGGNLNRAYAPFGGTPVCITELGYLSPDGYPSLASTAPSFAWAQDTSIAEHAQWLGEAVQASRASGIVRLLFIWNVDFTHYSADPQAGYAILRSDGSCPACATLRAAMGG
ncbi:MAG: hypothetical protein OXF83_00720 [Anaerolineaceae bacterium]|nr:hypothetical protein [Anaerolineaceae bacterium]